MRTVTAPVDEPGFPGQLSALALTPGTPFLLGVRAGLLDWISQRLARPAYHDLVFELSDATVQVGGAKVDGRGKGVPV